MSFGASEDLVKELVEYQFHFVYAPHLQEIQVLSYGELNKDDRNFLEELAEDYGMHFIDFTFQISDELKEAHHAEKGYAYVLSG